LTSPANGSVGTYCTCILSFVLPSPFFPSLLFWARNGSSTYAGRVAVERQRLHAGVDSGLFPQSPPFPLFLLSTVTARARFGSMWQPNGSSSYEAVWQSTGTGFTAIFPPFLSSFLLPSSIRDGRQRATAEEAWCGCGRKNGSLEYADVWASPPLSPSPPLSRTDSLSTLGCTCSQDIVMDINGEAREIGCGIGQNGSRYLRPVVSPLPPPPFSLFPLLFRRRI